MKPQVSVTSLSAPGFTLVSTSARQQPLSGDDVLSMVAMTGVTPAENAVAPSLTETAAAEEQWPWMQRRSAWLTSTRNVALAQVAPPAPSFAKPKSKPVVMAAQEQWPWKQRRARAAAQSPAPPPAMPIVVKAQPKPVARKFRKSSGPGSSAVRWSSLLLGLPDTRLSAPNA